jgi:hypothetical protein
MCELKRTFLEEIVRSLPLRAIGYKSYASSKLCVTLHWCDYGDFIIIVILWREKRKKGWDGPDEINMS